MTNEELRKLSLAEKRLVVGALLGSELEEPRTFPLSFAQEQLWFMDQLQPGSPVFNIPLYVPFEGPFEVAHLKQALNTLMRRHDMLRAHISMVNGEPRQIVEPEVPIELPMEDLSGVPSGEQKERLGQLLNTEVQQPFDLSGGVCIRHRLFRIHRESHLLSVTIHHILTDAWSLGIYVSELRKTYNAYRTGEQREPLVPLRLEYSDYAQWQRATLRGLRLRNLIQYWTQKLEGAPQILPLHTDHPRSADQTFNGTVLPFVFPTTLSDAVISQCRNRKVTTFMFLLACYYGMLYRYSAQEDIIVGAPVANRAHPELESIIGLFVNTLILRLKIGESDTFEEVLRNVRTMTLEAFEHQALPFEKLVDELRVERVPGYPPLYQVVFNFQNASLIESENPLPEAQAMERSFPFVHSNTAKVDLNLTITQNGSTLSGGIEYNTDLFDRATIEGAIAHYLALVKAVVSNPSLSLMDIPLSRDRGESVHAGPNRHAVMTDLSEGHFSFELES